MKIFTSKIIVVVVLSMMQFTNSPTLLTIVVEPPISLPFLSILFIHIVGLLAKLLFAILHPLGTMALTCVVSVHANLNV
jgi:hypothetical protein